MNVPFAKYNWIALSFRGCTLDTPGFEEFIVKSLLMGMTLVIISHALGLVIVTWKRPILA